MKNLIRLLKMMLVCVTCFSLPLTSFAMMEASNNTGSGGGGTTISETEQPLKVVPPVVRL